MCLTLSEDPCSASEMSAWMNDEATPVQSRLPKHLVDQLAPASSC